MRNQRLTSSKPPVIRHGLIYDPGDQQPNGTRLHSAEWLAWLEEQSSFRFETEGASFTVRREARLGTSYWYAYRKLRGKLTSIYIGKSEAVTMIRLSAISEALARAEEQAAELPENASEARSLRRHAGVASEASSGYELLPPGPLPVPLTPIVDRVEDVRAITSLLSRPGVRLVTLVGAGGIGKTRVALEVASALHADFKNGVYFLAFDPLREAQMVLATVARTLGLVVDGFRSPADLLKECLSDKQMLLVLDNLEQVPDVAPQLIEILSACPDLRMLLTSRAILHLRGEYPYIVGPLHYPGLADLPALDNLLSYPAVELFIQGARATWAELPLAEADIQAIARICAHLEGLPLAIELAAARVNLLSPQALEQRLNHSLAILTQGGSERPARHRTLRAALDWSHELLTQDEQLVLRRLAVFSGGCDLEGAEFVCARSGVETSLLDVLASLIDKSLLLPVNSTSSHRRLRLSEPVREYALESLTKSGELEAVEEAHAAFYLSLALSAAPELDCRNQDSWLAQLDSEDRNLGTALNFWLSRRDYKRAVQLTGALGRFWYLRGRMSEGLNWTEQALSLRPAGTTPEESQALLVAGLFAIHLDQGERARVWLEESLRLCRATGDDSGSALASHMLTLFFLLKGNLAEAQTQSEKTAACVAGSINAWALATAAGTAGTLSIYLGDFARAHILMQRSAALFREAGDLYLSDLTLLMVADARAAIGARAQAQELLDEAMGSLEAGHSAWPAGYILCAYGQFALRRGDWSRARLLLERSLELFRRLNDRRGQARACLFLAQAAINQQDYTSAVAMARQCIVSARAAGAPATVIGCLEGLADAAMSRGKVGWAAQLWGAAARQREGTDPQHRPIEPAEREQLVVAAQESLGPDTFEAAWDEGRVLPLEQLLSVENLASSMAGHPATAPRRPAGLTPRELEVVLLVADGISNPEIAERLVISPATVVSYLNLIYKKLNVSSRTAAMRYVIDNFR